MDENDEDFGLWFPKEDIDDNEEEVCKGFHPEELALVSSGPKYVEQQFKCRD